MTEQTAQSFDAAAMHHLLNAPWTLAFGRDGTEDYGVISDATGNEIVASHLPGVREGRTCWLPEEDGEEVPTLVHQLRVMTAAPKLLAACKLARKAMEKAMGADDAQASTRIEWEAEPMRTLRAAIAEAESGQAES